MTKKLIEDDGTRRFHVDDIYSSKTPDDHIAEIPVEKVYQWVKTGKWKQKHFLRWLRVLRVVE